MRSLESSQSTQSSTDQNMNSTRNTSSNGEVSKVTDPDKTPTTNEEVTMTNDDNDEAETTLTDIGAIALQS